MIKDFIQTRKFDQTQQVSFTGGEGIIKSFEYDAGEWVYLIEMPLGTKPDFGRIGAETRVLLSQAELRAI
jgi:hypothetical protein